MLRQWLEKVRARFVSEARYWYKHLSMQLAALVTMLTVFLLQSPDIIISVLNSMPHELRAWMPAWLGPVMFGVVFIARYWKQTPKKPDA